MEPQQYRRYIISKCRSELGKKIRKQYMNDKGVPYAATKGFTLRLDGVSTTITTFTTDNNVLEIPCGRISRSNIGGGYIDSTMRVALMIVSTRLRA